MPAVALPGVTIAWSGDAPHDPLAAVLALATPVAPGAPAGPTLTVALRPAGPEAAADPRAEGWEPSFVHGIVQAYRGPAGFLLHDRASRVLVPDGDAPVEILVAPRQREVEPGSAVAMLEVALPLALRRFGLFHIHAAALEHASGAAVLVVGGSGAGKTSTTLALLEDGARYLGDDAHFLAATPGGTVVSAFPRAFHLGPATLAAFPRLAALAGPPSGRREKRPVDPRLAWPDRHLPALALPPGRVLALFPSIADAAATEIVPLGRADAFGLLLTSSASLVIEGLVGGADNFAILQAVLAVSRCFELRLGRDALADPRGAVAERVTRSLG
jgi:hypothetical protein